MTLIGGCALGQAAPHEAAPPQTDSSQADSPQADSAATSSIALDNTRQKETGGKGLTPDGVPRGKASLVRGVLKRLDPVHDQLLIHAFGGGDVRVKFDPRTKMLAGNEQTPFTTLPVGSVVSVDTVMDGGKLFALSVRAGSTAESELDGQVVRYDAAKSQLMLRDPMSPDNFTVKINSSSAVSNQGKAASVSSLAAGTLVRAWFAGTQRTVTKIEILAEPGQSFTFQGKVIAIDLRSHVLSLSNDTDQSIRELAIDSLDSASVGLLRENANVRILAEFDGERYKVRSLSLVTPNP